MAKLYRIAIAGLVAVAFFSIVGGCGPGEPAVYDVSGQVTFAGKAIPRGMVSFEPDVTKGGKGQMGYAEIVESAFDTKKKGKGVYGGPYIVRISAFDGKISNELAYGAPLFPEYRTAKEFPKEASTLEIDVPKPAGK